MIIHSHSRPIWIKARIQNWGPESQDLHSLLSNIRDNRYPNDNLLKDKKRVSSGKGRSSLLLTFASESTPQDSNTLRPFTLGRWAHVSLLRAEGTADTFVSASLVDLGTTESDVPSVSELSLTNGKVPAVDELYPEDSANTAPQSELLQESGDLETQRGHVECKAEGAVPWFIVKRYLSAMGSQWYWAAVLPMFMTQQIASLVTNLWIKNRALQYDNSEARVNAWYHITIYVAFVYSLCSCHRAPRSHNLSRITQSVIQDIRSTSQ
ncbi:hypothetical protein TSTA_053080 [Talaromyces stipitatus ATCC 10500]|uniref:Uncharacterized protein n=1 Tax=Talaromyces stipitatus (strain ATCC 10500 / CBS 375.48 / QM 6759 / NRRL 1006) TaxID=441959 RepID=B8MQV5_TALSN|nr:uncharacterized protein TSTA_053080 [Talaromyces stipitatus ATCC 10500]EED12790.1 hypothetical protein TSTA_053080 [Talaromyces stipitatus ATCC 10500]